MLIHFLGVFQLTGLYFVFVLLSKEMGGDDVKVWGAVLMTQIPLLVSLLLLDRRVRKEILESQYFLC